MSTKSTSQSGASAYHLLRNTDFRLFILARLFMTFSINMLGTTVAWHVYSITHDEYSLGLIGLAEFIPFVIVTLIGGYVADIFDRKKIMQVCIFLFASAAFLLFYISYFSADWLRVVGAMPLYTIVACTGLIRGFLSPAQSSFMAQLIDKSQYAQAAVWGNITWHVGAISGPALVGLMFYFLIDEPSVLYLIVGCMVLVTFGLATAVQTKFSPKANESNTQTMKKEGFVESIKVGWRFVFQNPYVLGSLTLDMFAVLFGGAVAMLPAFAEKVLHLGPSGLGLLRAAPAVGAVCMAAILTYRPPVKHSGKLLLGAVAGFGVCTILFALSQNFYFSLLMLAGTGFFDDMSMAIRGTVIQLYTPDEMRGRVSAVNSLFIGSSNELGAYESGLAARLMGLVPSVIFGGFMTILVVGATWWKNPKLRDLDFRK